MAQDPIPGGDYRSSRAYDEHKTSKSGRPRVSSDEPVSCDHCGDVHRGTDDAVGRDIPMGHGRWEHYTCPETGNTFAAKKGSNRRVSE